MDGVTLREWENTMQLAAEIVAYEGYKDTANELLAIRDKLSSLVDYPEVPDGRG